MTIREALEILEEHAQYKLNGKDLMALEAVTNYCYENYEEDEEE